LPPPYLSLTYKRFSSSIPYKYIEYIDHIHLFLIVFLLASNLSSSWLILPSARITGMCHHAWLSIVFHRDLNHLKCYILKSLYSYNCTLHACEGAGSEHFSFGIILLSSWRASFNISCKHGSAGDEFFHLLYFWTSISPYLPKVIVAQYRILGWHFFCFSTFKILPH
jgi:hypothetical protein